MKRLSLEELKAYIQTYVPNAVVENQLLEALDAGQLCRNVLGEVSGTFAEEVCAEYDKTFLTTEDKVDAGKPATYDSWSHKFTAEEEVLLADGLAKISSQLGRKYE